MISRQAFVVSLLARFDDGFLYSSRTTPVIMANLDYLPFGELNSSDSGITSTNSPATSATPVSESGLDHTWFRQYSSSQGRWPSPDPLGIGAADLSDPQSLNLYAYARNNPLNSIDPLGLYRVCIGGILYDETDFFVDGKPAGTDLVEVGSDNNSGNEKGCLRGEYCGRSGDDRGDSKEDRSGNNTNGNSNGNSSHSCFGGDALCDSQGRVVRVNGNIQSTIPANLAIGAAIFTAWDATLVQEGRLFGTRFMGNRPLLNASDKLRIGWSHIKETGEYVFRIGGDWLKPYLENPHINLWPPRWWGGPPGL